MHTMLKNTRRSNPDEKIPKALDFVHIPPPKNCPNLVQSLEMICHQIYDPLHPHLPSARPQNTFVESAHDAPL